ncbi:hypothetical protein MHM88_05670 [Epibacterium sp. MM17-32]|uniref:hypothetical protein n=1 Tax=Epibacterium sp. MM17-32 TaxID=2917734 RepID=UPI001EF741E4|nr:hypothetical protein [Epibacterium sp. MM17-32]MCG7627287.1 hypothetical protein [Epibacterium sp. MM17-32]
MRNATPFEITLPIAPLISVDRVVQVYIPNIGGQLSYLPEVDSTRLGGIVGFSAYCDAQGTFYAGGKALVLEALDDGFGNSKNVDWDDPSKYLLNKVPFSHAGKRPDLSLEMGATIALSFDDICSGPGFLDGVLNSTSLEEGAEFYEWYMFRRFALVFAKSCHHAVYDGDDLLVQQDASLNAEHFATKVQAVMFCGIGEKFPAQHAAEAAWFATAALNLFEAERNTVKFVAPSAGSVNWIS